MSSMVDERVVSMSFDNSKFDKNVQQSVDSINNLKSSLNFDESKTSFKNLSKSANSIDLSGIEKSLTRLNRRFSAFGVAGMTVISNLTTHAMGMAKKSMNWLTQGVIQGGINRAKNIQQAKFQLKGLGVEWEKISDDIDYAVSGTAYGMDSAAKAASQLVASNVELGDSMKTALRGISGLAAMTNSSYDDMARIFTTVAGNGRLMGDQLNQISARGINAAATLGKYLGKSEKEIRDMVSRGKIDFDTFAKAMDSAFGEHAKEANITFQGSMSNVRAALGRIGELFVTPLIEDNGPIVKFFNTLRLVIDNIKKASAEVSGTFLRPVIKSINKATQWMRNLYHVTGNTFERYGNIIRDAGGSVDKFEKGVSKALKKQGVDVDALVKKYGSLQTGLNNLDNKTRWEAIGRTFLKMNGAFGYENTDSADARLEDFMTAYKKAADEKGKIDKSGIKELKKQGYEYDELKGVVDKYFKYYKEETNDSFDVLQRLTKEELKSLGLNKEAVQTTRHMQQSAKMAGMDLRTYYENLINIEEHGSGGVLILKTIKNLITAILRPLSALGKAFMNVFGIKNNEVAIYNLIYSIEQFSEKLIMSDETVEMLTKTFELFFTIIKWGAKLLGGALFVALKVVGKVLSSAGTGLLEITSDIDGVKKRVEELVGPIISKAVKKFKEFIELIKPLGSVLLKLLDPFKRIKSVINAYLIDNGLLNAMLQWGGIIIRNYTKRIREWFESFKKTEGFNDFIFRLKFLRALFNKLFGEGPERIKKFLKTVKELDNANIFDVIALKKAFKEDILDYFFDAKKWKALASFSGDIVKKLFENVRDKITKIDYKALGKGIIDGLTKIVSGLGDKLKGVDPSTWQKIGVRILDGLKEGMKSSSSALFKAMADVGEQMLAVIKNILGIHSPSTKAIEIGKNVIDGFIIGLKGGLSTIIKTIKGMFGVVGKNVPKFAKGLFVIFGSVKILAVLAGLAKTLSTIVSPFTALTNLMNNMALAQKQMARTLKAAMWVEYAIAISLFADAVVKLGKLKLEEAAIGVGSIVALLIAFTAMSVVLNRLDDKKLAAKLIALSSVVAALGWFLVKAAGAFYILGKMDDKALSNAASMIVYLTMWMGAMFLMAKYLVGNDKKDLIKAQAIGLLLTAYSQSLLILADAIRRLGKIDPTMISQAQFVIREFSAIIAILLFIGGIGGGNKGFAVAACIVSYTFALLMLAKAIPLLGALKEKDVTRAYYIIVQFGTILAILSAFATKFGGGAAATGFVILAFAGSMIILAEGIKRLAGVKDAEVNHALNIIVVFGEIMSLLLFFSIFTKHAFGVGFMLLSFAGSMVILAKAIKDLSAIDKDAVKRALFVVEQFSIICAAFVLISTLAGKGALYASTIVLSMAAAMVVLAAACALMSFIDPKDLTRAAFVIEGVLLSIALVVLAANGLDKNAFKSLIVIAVMMGEMMASLIILTRMDFKQVITAASAMVAVVLSVGAVIYALSNMEDKDFKKAQKSVLLIIELIAAMAGAVIALCQFPSKAVIAAGAVMAGAMLAFAASLYIISKAMDVAATAAIKIAAAFAIIMAVVVLAMLAIDKLDIEPSKEAINNVIKLLLTFSAMMLVLTAVGLVAPAAVAGSQAMIIVIGSLMGFLFGVGLLFDKVKFLEKFVGKGISVLKGIAFGLGEVIGSLVAGALAAASSSLPYFGKQLSEFMDYIVPFFDSVTKIDKDSVKSLKDMADAIKTFLNISQTIGADQEASGEKFQDLSIMMTAVAEGLVGFGNKLSGLDESFLKKVKLASQAAKALAEMANAIPNTGGLAGTFKGENDLALFGAELPGFAENLVNFANAVEPIKPKVAERIRNAADAAKALAEFADAIPNQGGWIAKFSGENNIGTFGKQLPNFGTALKGFSDNVEGVNPENVKAAAKSAKYVVGALNEIEWKGTKVSDISTSVSDLGTGVSGFYTNISGVDVAKLAAFDVELKALVGILGSMANTNFEGAGSFKKALSDIAGSGLDRAMATISGYKDKFSKAIGELFSSISSTAKNSGKGVNFGSSFKTALKSALKTINGFKDSFSKAGSNVAKAFSKGFNNSKVSIGSGIRTSLKNCVSTINGYKDNFAKAGAGVSSAFSKGFNNKKSSIGSSIKTALKNCKSMIDGYKDNFSSAGANLAKGFANGIENNSWRATNAGRSIAKAAYKAAKAELDEHSPSKVMMEVGKFFTEGFANGIANSSGEAIDSAKGVAKSTMSYVLQAVGEINSMMDENLNYQPVIAPVVDTSALSSDLSNIDSSLNSSYAFGLGATINVRNKSMEDMASTIVNGVKNAVGDLIDNAPTPVYTFESPLYIDGREVARSTAAYTQEELDKIQARNNRQMGIL